MSGQIERMLERLEQLEGTVPARWRVVLGAFLVGSGSVTAARLAEFADWPFSVAATVLEAARAAGLLRVLGESNDPWGRLFGPAEGAVWESKVIMWAMALRTDEGWGLVRPTGGSPYAYATPAEASRMLRICYPDQVNAWSLGEDRIVDVVPVTIGDDGEPEPAWGEEGP